MKPITKWLPELRTSVPGADDSLIQQQLFAALREFFTRGGGWKQELDPITLKEGRANYSINPQPQGIVLYPDKAWIVDPEGTEGNRTYVEVYPDAELAARTPRGPGIYRVDESTIALAPPPNAIVDGRKLYIVAIWGILPGCKNVPDAVFDNWFDEILDGAKQKLFIMPSKPWSSTALASYHGKRFNSGIGRFRAVMRKGYTTAEPAWSYPGWA